MTVFEEDIKKLEKESVNISVGGKEIELKVKIVSHMMDMKAAHLYFGLGGAYCDLCDMSKEECHNIDIVEAGFKITRNVEDLHLLFEENSIEDGSVVRK